MSKRGRKPILTENETKEIINSYVLKHGVSKRIKYIDLHNYCIELHQNKELPKIPSESYWRKKDRAGRKLIDEVNSALSHKVKKHEKNYQLQSLLNLIDNSITNKELKTTLFNELESKQKKVDQLEKELNEKKDRILSLKKSNKDLNSLNKRQQELISQVFYYFLNKSSDENLDFFDSALKEIFSQPLDYLLVLKKDEAKNQNNIAGFFKKRLKNN